MSTSGSNCDIARQNPTLMEDLEARLLLSTVSVGDQFIYREANGSLIRVDVQSTDVTGQTFPFPPVGQIELMRWEAGNVADMPGWLNGAPIDGGATYRRLDEPRPNVSGRTGIVALASAGGVMYAFDSATSELVSLNPVTGATITNLGQVPDSVEPTFYWDIRAMATSGGNIVAVGYLVDSVPGTDPALPNPAGPYLITITGLPGAPVGQRGPVITRNAQTTTIGFTDLTYIGGTLYGTDGAAIYGISAGGAVFSQVNLAVGGMEAIEYVGGTMYGVSGDQVYTINMGNGDCTALNGYLGRDDLNVLASLGGELYGMFPVGNRNRLALIRTDAPANSGLFSIYIAQSDRYTVLSMSTIGETRQAVYIGDMQQNIDVFTTLVPNTQDILLYDTAAGQTMVLNPNPNFLQAPAGSGAVAVGSVGGIATTNVDVFSPAANPLGVFPGGDVYGGIFMDQEPLTNPLVSRMDMGRILVAGTVAGSVRVTGSLDVLEVGYLYGNVHVGYDVNNIIIQTDFARASLPVWPDNALISVGGMLREIDIFGTSYGTINVDGGINILDRDPLLVNHSAEPIWEMEYRPLIDPFDIYYVQNLPNALRRHWTLDGQIMTVSNDTADQAQFLYNATGTMRLWGNLLEDFVQPDDDFDWYAISLLAGQTIRLDTRMGHIDDPRETLFQNVIVSLMDAEQHILGSAGEETVEDEGFNSRGSTPEALTFTAPQAGVYYLRVAPAVPYPGDYTVFLYDSTAVSLGAVDVAGDYRPSFGGTGATYGYDIAVRNGSFGAFEVTGGSYSNTAFVIGGGDLVSYRAGTIGPIVNGFYTSNLVISDGSIGMVENVGNTYLAATIVAGATDGFYDDNAFIQNIHARGELVASRLYQSPSQVLSGVWATGSIGTIIVDDYLHGASSIHVNYDDSGPGARMDLLWVGGDWGTMNTGIPTLAHGINSDIGMVRVEGTIYTWYGGNVGPLQPTSKTQGQSVILEDDGGARVRVTPALQVDDNGDPVEVNGEEVPSQYSYYVIPVQNVAGEKIGGVVARFDAVGPVTLDNLTAGNTADIGLLNLTGNGSVSLTGVGGINVYQVVGDNEVDGFANATDGDVVCGHFEGLTGISVQGNLGRVVGDLGQWLEGVEVAAAASQAGYFNRKVNGIVIDGDVQQVLVGGWLGDLLVTGLAANIEVNADGLTSDTGFDGVIGVVHAGEIGTINVGDGLADDGSGDRARAAILSGSTIHRVEISGAGNWIDGSVLAIDAIEEVVGTDGASLTAIVSASPLTGWSVRAAAADLIPTGWIGNVSFSGVGAIIEAAEITGQWVGVIETSVNSDGILHCWFSGSMAAPDTYAIAGVKAGGPGLTYTDIAGNGGSLGPIQGVGPNADIVGNNIDCTDGLVELSGRRIYENTLSIPGTVGKMSATLDIFGNFDVSVGAIESLSTGTNFAGNYFQVATEITTARIGGNFASSDLILRGPQGTRLGLLDVQGNISGTITVAGSIGSIYSRTGLISATITTVENPTSADVDLIWTKNGYSGSLSVAGNVRNITSMATMGIDPSTLSDYVPKRFDIAGNLTTLLVRTSTPGQAANLYTALYIGGSLTTLNVAGSIFGDIRVNGNITTLQFTGDMGGVFNLPAPTRLGSVTVFGSLTNFIVPTGANIVGDLTIGASIKSLVLSDPTGNPAKGNVIGNITSLYGSIDRLTVTNGRVDGNITAALKLGYISIRGTLADPANVTGNLTANMGGLSSLSLYYGNLGGNVSALGGDITTLSVVGGSVLATSTIQAVGSARNISVATGDFEGNLNIGGRVEMLNVGGQWGAVNQGGGARNSLIIGSGAGVLRVSKNVGNAVDNTVWQINGPVTQLMISGQITGATVGIAGDTNAISVFGAVNNTVFSGGYIAGQPVQSANLTSFTAGSWNSSQLTLGVDPGADTLFGTGDDVSAAGLSQLTRLISRGAVTGVGNQVVVDTGVTSALPAGIALVVLNGVQPALEPVGGAVIAVAAGRNVAPDGVTITLGGTGTGTYNSATGKLILNNTTTATSLTINKTGVAKRIDIEAGDDRSLATLMFTGTAQAGDLTFDGKINVVNVAQAANNSNWVLPGGATSVMVMGALNNVNLVAGHVITTVVRGAMTGGSITVRDLRVLQVLGNLSAPVTTTVGSIGTMNVTGSVTAPVTSAGGLNYLTAAALEGDVQANRGDIGVMLIRGDVSSNIQSVLGYIRVIQIINGSFGSLDEDMAIRSMTGIGSFVAISYTTTPQPRYTSGVISTNGKINQISITGLNMSTRVRAADGINVAYMDDMINGLLSSGSDIYTVVIRKNMLESDIVSGFDPGDAGFDAGNGGNAATVRMDARTHPQAWVTPGNVDRLAGGDIRLVQVLGNMTASTIAAAVGPGNDGWYYTEDDQVRGNGYAQRVIVRGVISGSLDPTQSFGIFAAGAMPNVTVPRLPVGNAYIDDVLAGGGAPRVAAVKVDDTSITIALTDDIDISTVNNPGMDPTRPTSFEVTISVNSVFGDADDYKITDIGGFTVTYSHQTRELKLRLTQGTWMAINKGTNFLVRLDGSMVTDKRGNPLDGEKGMSWPSGDGVAGGEFLYRFAYGDSGDTIADSTHLSTGVPILYANQVHKIRQTIGDNRAPALPQDDVDYYTISVHEGDVLYFWTPAPIATGVDPLDEFNFLEPSLSGYGYRATADADIRIFAAYDPFTGYLGPYELSILLFNDGNSNFTFDDATQAATALTWVGNTTSPADEVETILAPDDYDVYSLGVLPAWTRLDLSLDTLMIGSRLDPKMAVFNSAGELVGSIVFSENPGGDTLALDTNITLQGSVITTQADTYYVAIGDMYPVSPDEQVTGSYDLTVTRTQLAAQAPARQVVYVNFNGGVADYLLEAGNRVDAYQQPLTAARFGFDASFTQILINSVMDTIRAVYQNYTNITFTTVKPMTGQYSTIYVSNDYSYEAGLLGLAEQIDTDNSDHSDQCTVWGAEIASSYHAELGHTVEQVGKAIGNTAAHELGHILGLNHVQNEFTIIDFVTGEAVAPTNWVMGYSFYDSDEVLSGQVYVDEYDLLDLEFTTHENLMVSPSNEFLIGYQNSVASLWTIA